MQFLVLNLCFITVCFSSFSDLEICLKCWILALEDVVLALEDVEVPYHEAGTAGSGLSAQW